MAQITVIGTTAWGLTLGLVASRQGHRVSVLARTPDEADRLSDNRTSPRLPSGIQIPAEISIGADPAGALRQAEMVIVAVPSVSLRTNIRAIARYIPESAIVVSATKGIDIETGRRMTQVIAEETHGFSRGRIGALSGPNLAPEIASGKIASATVAFTDPDVAAKAQVILTSELFRVYRSDDVAGVELGGALKNIVAIGAGIIDDFSLGDNAKAAFVTRGLHEITRLGVALGARPDTFAGLSGMGDLVATCYSGLSRNRRVGQELAKGRTLADILSTLKQVAEGVPTTRAASKLAHEHGVDMPITAMTQHVLFDGLPPGKAVEALMRRVPQPEIRY